MIAALAFSLATLSPADARAIPAFMQVDQLLTLCGTEPGRANAELCSGYILGSVDQVLAEQDVWGRRRAALCLPADLSAESLKSSVLAYLRQGSGHGTLAAASVVAAALKANYACAPRRGSR